VKSPSKPKDPPEAQALRERQVIDLAKLDEQQNIKIKRMLNASRGSRMFHGSSLTRSGPSNTAGRALYSPRGSGSGGVAGGGGGPGAAGGGGGRGTRGSGNIRPF
jgi:hypothetical protein